MREAHHATYEESEMWMPIKDCICCDGGDQNHENIVLLIGTIYIGQ